MEIIKEHIDNFVKETIFLLKQVKKHHEDSNYKKKKINEKKLKYLVNILV